MSARTDDMAEINDLFCRIGRIQAILVWGALAAFVAVGREFVFLWAGAEFGEAYACVVVLMAGLSVSLVQNLGISLLQAKNKMGFRAATYTALALIDVAISIPVSARFGALGCAVVAACLLFLGTGPVMNAYYSRVIGVQTGRFFRGVLPLAVPAALAGVAIVALDALTGLAWSWGHIAILVLAFVALYGGLLWALFLNGYERGLAVSLARKLAPGRRLT